MDAARKAVVRARFIAEASALPDSPCALSYGEGDEMRKLTMSLPEDAIEDLVVIANRRGVTFTEALLQAIGTEKLLSDEESGGSTVLVQDRDGRYSRILINSRR